MTTTPFRDLLASPGVQEVCRLEGRVGFMAYHGGSLEHLTDVIADQVARRCGASFYAVLQPDDLQWHIPSHRVSPQESPVLREFVEHVDVVVTIHGYGRHDMWTTILLGGRHREFAEHVATHLRPALPDYTIETDLDAMPRELRGLHDDNPVNLPRLQGVQIELPPRVRGTSPIWRDWQGPGLVPHTESLIDGLVAAIDAVGALTGVENPHICRGFDPTPQIRRELAPTGEAATPSQRRAARRERPKRAQRAAAASAARGGQSRPLRGRGG